MDTEEEEVLVADSVCTEIDVISGASEELDDVIPVLTTVFVGADSEVLAV